MSDTHEDQVEKLIDGLQRMPAEIRDRVAAALQPPRSGTHRRCCLAVFEGQYNDHGYIPSVVFENEPGHSPMIGQGDLAEPWYFGRPAPSAEGWEQAQRICLQANEKLGLTEDDVNDIIISSMAAGNRLEGRMREVGLEQD